MMGFRIRDTGEIRIYSETDMNRPLYGQVVKSSPRLTTSMTDPFRDRTRRLQQRLRGEDVAGAVFFPSPNLYYLTGFWEEPMERPLLFVVPASGQPGFLAPSLYETQLRDDTWIEAIHTYDDGADPVGVLESMGSASTFDSGTVLIDPTMWVRFSMDLRRAFPSAELELADSVMGGLRSVKDDLERERLALASERADSVMEWVRSLGEDAIGMTEAELAAEIRDALLEAGDSVAFEVVVGSGPNGAKPHHRHGDRTIRRGDPVVLDFGLRLEHYPSDMTRTVVFAGDPPDAFDRIHSIVEGAQTAAIETVEPGVSARTVDEAARSVIEDHGFGDRFIHRTGHGIGLDVHEDPYIVSGNEDPLREGHVFSVEPGIYLDGEFGVRIEDLVMVTETGVRRLNGVPRGWRC